MKGLGDLSRRTRGAMLAAGAVIVTLGVAPATARGLTRGREVAALRRTPHAAARGFLPGVPEEATWPVLPWLTYHGSAGRGAAIPVPLPGEAPSVAWRSGVLDGDVYGEPLVYDGMVYVVTEFDTVYALAAVDGALVWHTSVGKAVARSAPGCWLDQPGITSTPVIDPTTGTIYVVAFAEPGQHYLVGLDAQSGRVRYREPADPPADDPLVLGQRGALALSGGHVYIPYGGRNGDCGEYHGWVVEMPAKGGPRTASYEVPTSVGGGIWGPSGVAVGGDGAVFVATGNGAAGSVTYLPDTYDYGQAVMRLGPGLVLADWFAPSDWVARNQADLDVGSSGPTLIAGSRVLQATKGGVLYLLDQSRLGGVGGELGRVQMCKDAFGATAYDEARHMAVVGCTDGLAGVRVGDDNTLSVAWHQPGYWATPPIIGNGVAWTLDTKRGELVAVGVVDGLELGRVAVGPVVHFTTPSVAGDLVLVATHDGLVAVIP